MPTRRITVIAALLLAFLPVLPIILGGCESKPAEPAFNNIFDPEGPELGDPLHVFAALGDTVIRVVWDQPQGFGIAFYEVSHSYQYGSGYVVFGTAEHTSATNGILDFPNPEPTTEHFFRVTALTLSGDFILTSFQTPGSIITPPRVVMGDGSGSTPTRNLALTVTVSTGDIIIAANNEDFTGSVQVAVDEPGTPQEIVLDLGPAGASGDSMKVFVKALDAGIESAVFADSVEVDFQPAFTIQGDSTTVATRQVTLAIPNEGVTWMRFALTAEALPDSSWLAGAAVHPGFELLDTLNPQSIFGEFETDFGFLSPVMEISVMGDPLTDAGFTIDLDGIAFERTVYLQCSAQATLMRFTEGPDFTGVPWQDYAEYVPFVLSSGAGLKTVFAQFRNDFTDSPVLTASVEYILQPLAVGFLAPLEGESVTGETLLQISGWAVASGEAAVDSVKIDTGDGAGFLGAVGREDWSLMWNVPQVEAETPIILRARAWSAADSTTAQVSVNLVP